jgi:hypothetical protein
MSLIFEDTAAGPHAHALVIGVGGYRHLQGGVAEREPTLEHVGALRQLTSPPRSALAFAQWLVASAQDWTAPLGSVDLLVSPAPEDPDVLPDGMAATPATHANIEAAYEAWQQRCDEDDDNIAIFYFCGHGVEKSEQYLLAEDFGATANPWRHAFAFESTRLAFKSCRARTHLFFIDACRKITSAMLTTAPQVAGLGVVSLTGTDPSFSLAMQAAAANEAALGPRRGVSYATQALLRALQGGAATRLSNGWVVETGQVAARITEILATIRPSEGSTMRCPCHVISSTPILKVAMPKVGVVLSCRPTEANPLATLSCRRFSPPGPEDQHQGAPWEFQVDAGFYQARATFSNGRFRQAETMIFATPPMQRPILECQ